MINELFINPTIKVSESEKQFNELLAHNNFTDEHINSYLEIFNDKYESHKPNGWTWEDILYTAKFDSSLYDELYNFFENFVCQVCDGSGSVVSFNHLKYPKRIDCSQCNGQGVVK